MSIDFIFLLILFPLVLHLPPTNTPLSHTSVAFSLSLIKMYVEPSAETQWNSFLAKKDNSVLDSLPDSIPYWSWGSSFILERMSVLPESLSGDWRKVEGQVSGQLSAGKYLMKDKHLSRAHCSLQEKTRTPGFIAAMQMSSGLLQQEWCHCFPCPQTACPCPYVWFLLR